MSCRHSRFYASRDKLATVGLENRLEELNRAAVRIAREVAGDKCLVAGNLSLTWMYEPGSPAAADQSPQDFRRATGGASGRRCGLHYRRDFFMSWRGSDRRGAREEKRSAGDGDNLLRK